MHEGIREHGCDICKKVFSHKSNLKLHIDTVHEGKKIHACNICGKSYGQKSQLKRHIKTAHEEESQTDE